MLDNNDFRCEILVDGSVDGLWALGWVISMLNLIGGKWKYLEYIGLVYMLLLDFRLLHSELVEL